MSDNETFTASSAESEQDSEPRVMRPFDPSQQRRVVRGRLHAFDMINERFARHCRMSLFNLIRRSADISVESTAFMQYGEFATSLKMPANINVVAMKPLRGNILVVFPPELVHMVVDSLFGGDGKQFNISADREFTHTEMRIIRRLLDLAMESYAEGWRSIYPVEMEYQRSETQLRFTNITNSDNETVMVSTFHVEVGRFETSFTICKPYAMIEPIREILSGPMQKADHEEEQQRFSQLSAEVKGASVELTADFVSLEMTVAQLSRMSVGDVLPIELPEEIEARVDGVPVFNCNYGRLKGKKALRVTRLIDHDDKGFEDKHS